MSYRTLAIRGEKVDFEENYVGMLSGNVYKPISYKDGESCSTKK